MRNQSRIRLWRVDWVHRNGYHAPSKYVEAKNRKNAHELVIEERCRLADFPDCWSFSLECLDHKQENGKWLSEAFLERREYLRALEEDPI